MDPIARGISITIWKRAVFPHVRGFGRARAANKAEAHTAGSGHGPLPLALCACRIALVSMARSVTEQNGGAHIVRVADKPPIGSAG